jgi:hypothetical protein
MRDTTAKRVECKLLGIKFVFGYAYEVGDKVIGRNGFAKYGPGTIAEEMNEHDIVYIKFDDYTKIDLMSPRFWEIKNGCIPFHVDNIKPLEDE